MTLTITDAAMSSDRSTHAARHSAEQNDWHVSWLPRRLLDRKESGMTRRDAYAERADPEAGS